MQGFPFGPRYSWTAQVERLLPVKMLNYGVCGDCCDDIVFRVRQYVLPQYVRHVLFLGGANDMLQRRSLSDIMADYRRLYEFCAEKDYALAIVLPFVSADAALNRGLLNLRQELEYRYAEKAQLLDLQLAIGLDDKIRRLAYCDGVHPQAATYEAIGSYAAPLLQRWLEQTAKGGAL